jgi:hypothetical protein
VANQVESLKVTTKQSSPQNLPSDPPQYQALATLGYVSNMMFIKLSIALFLLRIAVDRRYVWILRCSIFVVTVWSTAIFIFDLLQCRPIAAQWDLTIKNAKCVAGDTFAQAAYSISVMTIATDWLYALLPVPMIWNVQMTLQQKITVILILSLGVLYVLSSSACSCQFTSFQYELPSNFIYRSASIATIIRLKYIVDLTDISDVLFTGTTAMIWTIIEPAVAITAASLVTIRPLLRTLKIAGFESSERRSGRAKGSRGYGRSRDRREQINDMPLRSDVPKNNWTSTVGSGKEPTKVFIRGINVEREARGSKARDDDVDIKRTPSESPLTFYRDTGSEEHIMDDVHVQGIGIRRTVDVEFERQSVGRTL